VDEMLAPDFVSHTKLLPAKSLALRANNGRPPNSLPVRTGGQDSTHQLPTTRHLHGYVSSAHSTCGSSPHRGGEANLRGVVSS
jgi:hypothetical protein